jgi:hypothetical protein
MESIAIGKSGEKRVDRIATICTRLYLYLKHEKYKPEDKHKVNLVEFILLESIPNDLKMSFFIDLNKESKKEVKEMLKDKKLARLLLESL